MEVTGCSVLRAHRERQAEERPGGVNQRRLPGGGGLSIGP